MREPSSFETSVDCGVFGELDLTVWYFFTPADPGQVSGPPENCYPPTDAEVEVTLLEWPCDSGYLSAQWSNLSEDVQMNIIADIIEHEKELAEQVQCDRAEEREIEED